jgi:hypothetical protein
MLLAVKWCTFLQRQCHSLKQLFLFPVRWKGAHSGRLGLGEAAEPDHRLSHPVGLYVICLSRTKLQAMFFAAVNPVTLVDVQMHLRTLIMPSMLAIRLNRIYMPCNLPTHAASTLLYSESFITRAVDLKPGLA